MGNKRIDEAEARRRMEQLTKVMDEKKISRSAALHELGWSYAYYAGAVEFIKKLEKKSKSALTKPKPKRNEVVQVVVDKREDVNIVIMKGNADTVKEIASSLSGIFGGE